jgi:hypothetical protein
MANLDQEHDVEDFAEIEEAKCKEYESGKEDEEEDEEEGSKKRSKKKMKKVEEETDVSEETLAASSLHPKAAPGDPMSKLGAMHGVMNVMAGMGKSDLIDFFNQVQAQFGPGKTYGVGDNSAHNSSTLDMKPSDATASSAPKTKDGMPRLNVKEDIEEMFNGQDLTEESKETLATLFEAAVSARVIAENTRLQEAYEASLQEEIANFNEEVTSKLDTYLDYVVENWMKENEVAIESSLRAEITEDFIEGLRNLFAEHYIDVPSDKVDVLEAMAEKVAALEEKVHEVISENVELKNALVEDRRQDIFVELASDLALTQQEKFAALAEGIEFDGDLDTYAKKLMIVKENYFNTETTSYSSNIEEETFEGELTESTKSVDPVVGRYVQAIARTVKK